jgi:hypothetical protein
VQVPQSEATLLSERQLLERLRVAVSMPLPGAAAAGVPANVLVDLTTLESLAQSQLPMIRLRARFHLLGQCVLATEAADRAWLPQTGAGAAALAPDASSAPRCAGRQAAEPLRVAQNRLLKSLLQAWRGRQAEPLTDLVAALASFASRDNPPLDGPRISR